MELKRITEIAQIAGIPEEALEPYGKYKAKISSSFIRSLEGAPQGKLVLVSAITPTKAGEGKTTTSIALAEGFGKIGQKAMLCLREPSLGPVFGIKGGATGGGKASVAPSEDINLHFTGDMHALTSSINLISAIIDNELWQGNELGIDPNRIVWKRAMDMNDRALREVALHGNDSRHASRDDSFLITVASELMAIFCLAKDEEDFLARVQSIIVAYTYEGKPVTVKDLRISHAIMKLMRQALMPNLVQTVEGNPCIIHGGPFANIAHGCNSIIATSAALRLAPITVTEAGFGADLGAEKFLDIKCVAGGFTPSAVVMVATIRALKMHGGQEFDDLKTPNVDALAKGVCNLETHMENIASFGVPAIVAINHFASDSPEEIAFLERWCEKKGYRYSFLDGFEKGGEGAIDLAVKVQALLQEEETHYHPIYDLKSPIKTKIETICKTIYRAGKVEYEPKALEQIASYEKMGFGDAFICMAKTPQSFTDDPKVLGAPSGHTIHIREVNLSAGARFVIPLTGEIMTMPGLPKVPAAKKMEDQPW